MAVKRVVLKSSRHCFVSFEIKPVNTVVTIESGDGEFSATVKTSELYQALKTHDPLNIDDLLKDKTNGDSVRQIKQSNHPKQGAGT